MPENEVERLQALARYHILDSAPEPEYAEVAQAAASVFQAPVSLVGFVDARRVWIKAASGTAATEFPRDVALCSHTIIGRDVVAVPDTYADPRFRNNPLVTGGPRYRFHVSAPLITPDGFAVGALSVADSVPRTPAPPQCEALRALASKVVSQLELRRIREELAGARELQKGILAASRDCVKVLDLSGKLLFVNEDGLEALEISDVGPLLNRSWIDFWQGDDRDAARDAVAAARAGRTSRFIGYFPTGAAPKPRWWDVVVSTIRDSSGAPCRILAVSRDVTAAKQSEIALEEACAFNRQIIRDAPSGIMVCDTEMRYRVFNPFMEQLTGRTAADVVGKPALEVFPGLCASGVDSLLRRALTGEVVHAEEVCIPNHSAQGGAVWESSTYAPQRDANGNIMGAIALVSDVTERHRAEEIFQALVRGTASSTGADFFASLVEHLAGVFGARFAFVAECDNEKDARVLACWKDGGLAPNFEFTVSGSPCERVVRGETLHYPCGLQSFFPDNRGIAAMGGESYLGLPAIDSSGKVIGHMVVMHDKPMPANARALDLIRIFAARAAAELKRRRAEAALEGALEQVKALQQRLEAENLYLQEEIQAEHNFEEIVGRSPVLLEALQRVEAVAPTDSTVLIMGESGCGKELIARAIHSRSRRNHRPLVKLNCGAIPTGLVESELFGHVRGAFTGALEKRVGRFELADGGTLFLDEVGELPLDVQVKLLRVLQEREFEPLGSSRTVRVNVRIVAATNRDLETAVREGRFRADLYYRLNVLPVVLPPLRQRRSDIPLLASFFLDRLGRQLAREFTGITSDTMAVLSSYDWPGNIRELQNVIERAVVLSHGPVLKLGRDLLPVAHTVPCDARQTAAIDSQSASLKDVERAHIVEMLCACRWVIEGEHGVAKRLEIHPNTLRSRMKKLGIVRAHC
jgi:PAS domain S-box-containing protein